MPRLLIIAMVALAAMFPAVALAAAQIPDRIRIDGQDYALHTNPLTPRLAASGWLPPEEERGEEERGQVYFLSEEERGQVYFLMRKNGVRSTS